MSVVTSVHSVESYGVAPFGDWWEFLGVYVFGILLTFGRAEVNCG